MPNAYIRSPVVQKQDIIAYCVRKGWTLGQFADYIVAAQVTGVPTDQVGLYGRCWQLVSEMLGEQEAAELADWSVDTQHCPYCGADSRITGGRDALTYCPRCEARVSAVRRVNGVTHVRWTPPRQQIGK
jgi:hypothetical protein